AVRRAPARRLDPEVHSERDALPAQQLTQLLTQRFTGVTMRAATGTRETGAGKTGARKDERQDGFAMLAIVVMVLPILFVIGSDLQTMSGRNSRLQLEVKEERAMLVAESGVDVALFAARSGVLVAGPHAVYHYTGTLAGGGSYTVTCTYLKGDGI